MMGSPAILRTRLLNAMVRLHTGHFVRFMTLIVHKTYMDFNAHGVKLLIQLIILCAVVLRGEVAVFGGTSDAARGQAGPPRIFGKGAL